MRGLWNVWQAKFMIAFIVVIDLVALCFASCCYKIHIIAIREQMHLCWQLQENSWFAIFQTRDLAILVVMTHLSQGSLSFWLSLVYFLWSLFMLYISYNFTNWSHDWQQISLELGNLLQKNTMHSFSFTLSSVQRGVFQSYPYPYTFQRIYSFPC